MNFKNQVVIVGIAALLMAACSTTKYSAPSFSAAGLTDSLTSSLGLSTDQATTLCERIRATVEQLEIPHTEAEPAGIFTVSAGVATVVPRDGVEPDQLVSMAESALEDAKKQGRNRVVGSSF